VVFYVLSNELCHQDSVDPRYVPFYFFLVYAAANVERWLNHRMDKMDDDSIGDDDDSGDLVRDDIVCDPNGCGTPAYSTNLC
jgi:hypothetical protein